MLGFSFSDPARRVYARARPGEPSSYHQNSWASFGGILLVTTAELSVWLLPGFGGQARPLPVPEASGWRHQPAAEPGRHNSAALLRRAPPG